MLEEIETCEKVKKRRFIEKMKKSQKITEN